MFLPAAAAFPISAIPKISIASFRGLVYNFVMRLHVAEYLPKWLHDPRFP